MFLTQKNVSTGMTINNVSTGGWQGVSAGDYYNYSNANFWTVAAYPNQCSPTGYTYYWVYVGGTNTCFNKYTPMEHSRGGRTDSHLKSVSDLLNYHNRGDGLIKDNKVSYDSEQVISRFFKGEKTWSGLDIVNKPETFSYSFPEWSFYGNNSAGHTYLSQLTINQQSEALLSLQSWSDVANVNFIKSGSEHDAMIKFGNTGSSTPHAYASPYYHDYPHSKKLKFEIWFNNKSDLSSSYTNNHPDVGNYGRFTYVHEIGHAIGLDHPTDYKSGATSHAEDSRQFSVMSYLSESKTGGDNKGFYASSPMMDDISAIQYLYGENMATRTGDTTYGFNSNSDRDYCSATSREKALIFCVWDAGGNDTLDFSGYSQNQRINLNAGRFSDVGGLKGNVSIANKVVIENAIGGSGDDVITGNSTNNVIRGGLGKDIIYGGEGMDQLWGGEGSDIFVFSDVKHSPSNAPDIIKDFESGKDKIDLSGFNQGKGSGFIHFVERLSNKDGEATLSYDTDKNISELALNVDGYPGFLVQIVGQANNSTDFIV